MVSSLGRLARGENKQSRSHLCIIVLQAQTISIHIDHGQDIDLLPNTYLSLRLPYHIVLQRIEYRKDIDYKFYNGIPSLADPPHSTDIVYTVGVFTRSCRMATLPNAQNNIRFTSRGGIVEV